MLTSLSCIGRTGDFGTLTTVPRFSEMTKEMCVFLAVSQSVKMDHGNVSAHEKTAEKWLNWGQK